MDVAPKHRAALPFIFITLMLDVLGIGLIIPVLPKLVAKLHPGSETEVSHTYGVLIATYALMLLVFAPIMGALSDRFGRRPVILVALAGSAIDYVAMAFAPALWMLFVTRAINGISGANLSACMAYIADVTPPHKRAAGYGMVGAAFGLGFVLGPLTGGFLGDIDLRLPFLAAAGLTAANWLYGLFVLPESLPPERRRPFAWSRANAIGSLRGFARFPGVLGMAGVLFVVQLAQFGLQSVWVLYTAHRYQWDSRAVGISLAVVGIGAAVVQGGLARSIIPRIGERAALLFGLGLAVLAYTAYGLATHGWMIYATVAVASLGAIAGPAAQAIITTGVQSDQQGELQGSLASLQSVAQVAGPLLGTGLFGYFISDRAPFLLPGAPFFACAVLALIALLLAARVARRVTVAPAG